MAEPTRRPLRGRRRTNPQPNALETAVGLGKGLGITLRTMFRPAVPLRSCAI